MKDKTYRVFKDHNGRVICVDMTKIYSFLDNVVVAPPFPRPLVFTQSTLINALRLGLVSYE